jgi:hypothetical protein
MKWQLSSEGRIVERHHENDAAWDLTAACAARARRTARSRGALSPRRERDVTESRRVPRADGGAPFLAQFVHGCGLRGARRRTGVDVIYTKV